MYTVHYANPIKVGVVDPLILLYVLFSYSQVTSYHWIRKVHFLNPSTCDFPLDKLNVVRGVVDIDDISIDSKCNSAFLNTETEGLSCHHRRSLYSVLIGDEDISGS
jgi:hypothetical protein